jgi:hypothetical protein
VKLRNAIRHCQNTCIFIHRLNILSFFYYKSTISSGCGIFIIEASPSHSDTPYSIGLRWASDQPNAETSTWQHTTLTTDWHPCPRWDSNPQSQQTSGHRPTPLTASPYVYLNDILTYITLLLHWHDPEQCSVTTFYPDSLEIHTEVLMKTGFAVHNAVSIFIFRRLGGVISSISRVLLYKNI